MLWICQTHLFATMRLLRTIILFYTYLRLCAIALGANLPTLRPAQLPDLLLPSNLTSLYDNETFLTSLSSNLTSLYDNLTSLALPPSNTTLLPNNHSLADSRLPPDPTFEHYGWGTISFSGYGARIDAAGVDFVLRTVLSDCRSHSYHAQMGTNTRIYTEDSVTLIFNPDAGMYWMTWALVRDRLVAFVTEYGYPEFDFTISHPVSGTILGRGTLKAIQSNKLPRSPHYMQFSDSSGVVKFSNYGPAIDMSDTLRLITEATSDCSHHPDPAEIIDAGALIYPEGSVTLTLGPGRLMTWGQWSEVLWLIKRFLDAYEYVSFDFDVGANQVLVGSGYLHIKR